MSDLEATGMFDIEIQQPKSLDVVGHADMGVMMQLELDKPLGYMFNPANPCHRFGFCFDPEVAREVANRLLSMADAVESGDTDSFSSKETH